MTRYRKYQIKFSEIAVVLILVALWAGVACSHARLFRMDSPSMAPTIAPGDEVKVYPIARNDYGEIGRYNIVTFRPQFETNSIFIFRVIGLPGETVAIENGRLRINDNEPAQTDLPESLRNKVISIPRSSESNMMWKLDEKHIFVVGDNLSNAYDSRIWGPLPLTNVLGLAKTVVRKDSGITEYLR